jgi:hypothetical protein
VCRRFERMRGGLFGAGWEMTPIPILLALPSSPMAIMVAGVLKSSLSRGKRGKELPSQAYR